LEWLRSLQLPTPDHQILQSNLQILETVNAEIRNADIQIAKDATTEEKAKLLITMPGVDYYAAMVLSHGPHMQMFFYNQKRKVFGHSSLI